MLTLLMLSLAAHGIANILCPVWRTASDDAKRFAMIGFLCHSVAVVVLAKRRLAVMAEKFKANHGIHWLDKDRASWCLIAAMLLTVPGCSCQTYREVNGKTVRTSNFVIDSNGIASETVHVEAEPTPISTAECVVLNGLWLVVGLLVGFLLSRSRNRAAMLVVASMLFSGCKAETVEWVGPHGMMRMGTVVFGTDQTHRRVIPTPDGPINLDSADRGSPESLQRVSNDVTTTVAVMTAFITVTSAIKSLLTSIEAVNATSKAAAVEKAAIGAGKAAK